MFTPLLKFSTSSVFKTPPALTETLYLIMTFFFFTKELHPRRLELKKRESERGSSQLATIFFTCETTCAMGGADLMRMRMRRSFNRTKTKTDAALTALNTRDWYMQYNTMLYNS